MILGPPSVGRPLSSKILPSMSWETGSLTVSPVKRMLVDAISSPLVPSNTWTTATPPPTSRTWPLRSSPLGVLIFANSPYPTPRTDSTNIRGPDISRTVLYSRPASETILFLLDGERFQRLEFLIALKKIHCYFSEIDPFGSDLLRIPCFKGVEVERVACQPVDGWEVASLGKFGVESPKDLDDTESVLSDRFGKVAPRR